MPSLRITTVPADEYYKSRITVDDIKPVAVSAFSSIMKGLTHPLSQEETHPLIKKTETAESSRVTSERYDLALEKFNRLFLHIHWGDGLPLIPPTPERVKWMLSGIRRDPKEVIGIVAPKNGIATIEKIAINAVMAGARPEYLPVIIAAMEGLTDKHFDLLHVMTSTGSFNLAIIVSGPIAREINMNSGIGFLGHGWRANNTIGRAVRLTLINTGHLWPGENDMALMGRPSAHTFRTFAENDAANPWKPYHASRGYQPEDSCVTVSTTGSYSFGDIQFGGGAVIPWNVETILGNIIAHISVDRGQWSAFKPGVAIPAAAPGKHLIVLHPEMVQELNRLGYTQEKLQAAIYDKTSVPFEDLTSQEIAAIKGGWLERAVPAELHNSFMACLKPGAKVPVLVSPEDIHIFVAGGVPGYSFGMKYFRIAHQTKLIRGALLTKSGR
ncbi:MAG: hypothetical protein JW932_14935 [Deltaproteobacteria bacterium]|nr:hypothetical protein [Deltaproteobacteria bacterium]